MTESGKDKFPQSSGFTYTAQEEIDRPLDNSLRQSDPGFKPAPMSDETKLKLQYSMRVAIICFVGIGVLVGVEAIFVVFLNGSIGESNIFSAALDLMRTVVLLALGFMFGNQSKS